MTGQLGVKTIWRLRFGPSAGKRLDGLWIIQKRQTTFFGFGQALDVGHYCHFLFFVVRQWPIWAHGDLHIHVLGKVLALGRLSASSCHAKKSGPRFTSYTAVNRAGHQQEASNDQHV